ncbi:hypothetical protein [Mycolicibacterium goodii]|uniref:Mammalian cell entry protein n=1 Tax=Mycolicibacterium goodii TaxID=134601 RepID=A0A0K0X6G8_MYCGD|nr:hypothetical protein AFA91_14580 [Mycolicibacterium goodii]
MSGRHSFRAFAQAEEERTDDETAEAPEAPETPEAAEEAADAVDEPEKAGPARNIPWARVLVFAVIPAVALLLTAGAAFLKWQIVWNAETDTARIESVEAAKDIAVEMLSYDPDTVEQHLHEALGRLTGNFRDSYTTMVNSRIIPIATAQRVTATAEVPAVGVVSASPDRTEVMMYVDQFVTVADQVPKKTTSTVRATMVRERGQWLLSEFEPVKP